MAKKKPKPRGASTGGKPIGHESSDRNDFAALVNIETIYEVTCQCGNDDSFYDLGTLARSKWRVLYTNYGRVLWCGECPKSDFLSEDCL